jgi:hypothetical protein
MTRWRTRTVFSIFSTVHELIEWKSDKCADRQIDIHCSYRFILFEQDDFVVFVPVTIIVCRLCTLKMTIKSVKQYRREASVQSSLDVIYQEGLLAKCRLHSKILCDKGGYVKNNVEVKK